MDADNLGAGCLPPDELINPLDGAVVNGDPNTVIIHVEDQITAHYPKTDEADVRFFFHLRLSPSIFSRNSSS
jgi:hypothetical protein